MNTPLPLERRIGIRQLSREAKRILSDTQQGVTFIVSVHGKPVAQLVPIGRRDRRPVLDELRALRAHNQERNLSQRIDEIVYGDDDR